MSNFAKSNAVVPTHLELPIKHLDNERIKELLIECGEAAKKFPIQVHIYRRYVVEGTEKENVTVVAGMLKNISKEDTGLFADVLLTNRTIDTAMTSGNFEINEYVIVAQTHYDRETDTNTVTRFVIMKETDYEAMQAARAEKAAAARAAKQQQKKDFKGKSTGKKAFVKQRN